MSYSQKEIIGSFINSLEKESYSKDELYEALENYLTQIQSQTLRDVQADQTIERMNQQIMKNIDTSNIPPAGSM